MSIPIPKPMAASILLAAVLMPSTLACNAPFAAPVPAPPPTLAPSEAVDALESFNSKWRDLNFATPTGPFELVLTEAELNAALAESLAENELENGSPYALSNVQLELVEGVAVVYATVNLEPLVTTGRLVAVPSIAPDNQVDITITSVEFGPLEVDHDLLAEMEVAAARSINRQIAASPFDITLKDVDISDGQMTITGFIAP